MGPLILTGIKLILDDQGNHLDSSAISLESFKSFRGHLFCKPVTSKELFFAVSYSKLALGIHDSSLNACFFPSLFLMLQYSVEIWSISDLVENFKKSIIKTLKFHNCNHIALNGRAVLH